MTTEDRTPDVPCLACGVTAYGCDLLITKGQGACCGDACDHSAAAAAREPSPAPDAAGIAEDHAAMDAARSDLERQARALWVSRFGNLGGYGSPSWAVVAVYAAVRAALSGAVSTAPEAPSPDEAERERFALVAQRMTHEAIGYLPRPVEDRSFWRNVYDAAAVPEVSDTRTAEGEPSAG
jgi:hypothetical protein